MKYPRIQFFLLLMAVMSSSVALANLSNASTLISRPTPSESTFNLSATAELADPNQHAASRAIPVHLAGWFGSSNNNSNKNNTNDTQPSHQSRMALPFTQSHVVYSQYRVAPWNSSRLEVNSSYVSGKGTSQEIMNQHQEQHQIMMNKGFSPPVIEGRHYLEINAQRHVLRLDYETEKYNDFPHYNDSH